MKKQMMLLVMYVMCSGGGLTLLKLGVNKGIGIRFKDGMFRIDFNYILILGMILYVVSFLLSLLAMSKMNLNYFYPISAGLIYVFVCILGTVLFKETVTLREIVGMFVIMIGVIIMNLSKSN